MGLINSLLGSYNGPIGVVCESYKENLEFLQKVLARSYNEPIKILKGSYRGAILVLQRAYRGPIGVPQKGLYGCYMHRKGSYKGPVMGL